MGRLRNVLFAGMVLLPLAVQAGEMEDLTQQILYTGSLDCPNELAREVNIQLRRALPGQLMNGFRQQHQLDLRWQPGQPNYDQARLLVDTALAGEEQANGPFYTYTGAHWLRLAIGSWTLEETRTFANFFLEPAGHLFWDDMVEVGMCVAGLTSLDAPPFAPLAAADKAKAAPFRRRLDGAEARFNARLKALPASQRALFAKHGDKLIDSFNLAIRKLLTEKDERLSQRVAAAVRPALPQIEQVIARYQP
jgi:hypothetical protein